MSKTPSILCAVLVAAMALGSQTPEGGSLPTQAGFTDFSGVWKLDVEASRGGDLDEIMKRQGLNYIERLLARSASVVNVIRQESNALLRIEVESPVQNHVEIQYLDGREQVSTNQKGRVVTSRTSWSTNAAAVVTRSKLQAATGEPYDFTATRHLADGGQTMRFQLQIDEPGGKDLEAVRVFRRVGSVQPAPR